MLIREPHVPRHHARRIFIVIAFVLFDLLLHGELRLDGVADADRFDET